MGIILNTRTDFSKLSHETQKIVKYCEDHGFPRSEYHSEYLVPPDLNRRVQVRETVNVADPAEVRKLVAVLERGIELPPPVMTADGYIVNGNTTWAAMAKLKYTHGHAIVLDAKYEGASEPILARLKGLGLFLNNIGPVAPTTAEIREGARTLLRTKQYTNQRISEQLNVTVATINLIAQEVRAEDRIVDLMKRRPEYASRLKAALSEFTATSLRKFGGSAGGFYDTPFIELVLLTHDAMLAPHELSDLIKRLKVIKSETEQFDLLIQEREENQERIDDVKATERRRPPASQQLRQSLGYLLSEERSAVDFKEHNPILRSIHMSTLRKAVHRLNLIIEEMGPDVQAVAD